MRKSHTEDEKRDDSVDAFKVCISMASLLFLYYYFTLKKYIYI